jgi:cobalt-zinc-cadmium efflux system protein
MANTNRACIRKNYPMNSQEVKKKTETKHSNKDINDMRDKGKSAMIVVLIASCSFMVVEIIAGFYTGSLALIADAGHMFSDVGAIILGLVAFWFASKPATMNKTYGYYRSEILAALINGIILILLSVCILSEAFRRFNQPPEVQSLPMLAVGIIGLIINIVSVKLLSSHAEKSLNVRAAYFEVLGDMLASIGVILGAIIIYFTKWFFVDALISGVIGILIVPRTWTLLRECTNILMEGTPSHIDLRQLRKDILAIPGIIEVHDIHVWTITSGKDALSCHIVINNEVVAEEILTMVTKIAENFNLKHSTIQVEQQCKNSNEKICNQG